MNYSKLFDKNSGTMSKYYEILEKEVEKYKLENKSILNGNKTNYIDLVENKTLSKLSKRPEKVLKDVSKYFQRAVIWENASTMINITPPVINSSLAASNFCNVYNPNFAQDESSGYLMTTEMIVVKYLSQLVGWDWKMSRGVFTFGGKGTNMYAVKAALNKSHVNNREKGVDLHSKIISNTNGHPCHIEICDWLGLGRDACLRLNVDKNGQVNLKELENNMCELIECGQKIPCIILNGGTTNEIIVDSIKDVAVIRDKLVKKYKLQYKPHIHVDSVIGWAWLMFQEYDYNKNPLRMNDIDKQKVSSLCDKIKQIKYADSFGADFHKTGFCPYISSCIIFKDGNDIYGLGGRNFIPLDEMKFGEYSPFEYSLELSRSAVGPVSAYVAMETLGIEGFQNLIYSVYKRGEYIRSLISGRLDFEVINNNTEGFATLFVIHKKDSNLRYLDYMNKKEVDEFLRYNNDFYKFCIEMLEKNKTFIKFTFSKSYKPFGAKQKMGALKIYQTSPISKLSDVKKCVNEIFRLKDLYDKSNFIAKDEKNAPIDFVYR